jgi:hypothetical protein
MQRLPAIASGTVNTTWKYGTCAQTKALLSHTDLLRTMLQSLRIYAPCLVSPIRNRTFECGEYIENERFHRRTKYASLKSSQAASNMLEWQLDDLRARSSEVGGSVIGSFIVCRLRKIRIVRGPD